MTESALPLDEFKVEIETLFGQPLTKPASDAAEDFWVHWSSFTALTEQRSLALHVDPLALGRNFPQYKRYHVWKGAGKVAILLGIVVIWFLWQLGALLIVVGAGLDLWGGRIKSGDAKKFSEDLMEEAMLEPSSGYAKVCAHYIAGTIQLVSPICTAHWPQFPSNVVTGEHTFISTSDNAYER